MATPQPVITSWD